MSTIQSIIESNIEAFTNQYSSSYDIIHSLTNIINCRTKLGCYVSVCPKCGKETIGFCSCDDRNCIICANRKNEVFLAREKQDTTR